MAIPEQGNMVLRLPDGRKIAVKDAAEGLEVQVQDVVETFKVWAENTDIPRHEIPSIEEVELWMRGLVTAQGGRLRFLKQPRQNATKAQRGAFNAFMWHKGNGSLWGPVMARFELGDALYGKVETFGAFLLAYSRQESKAVNAWKRTGMV